MNALTATAARNGDPHRQHAQDDQRNATQNGQCRSLPHDTDGVCCAINTVSPRFRKLMEMGCKSRPSSLELGQEDRDLA